jgi:hypothetical protein
LKIRGDPGRVLKTGGSQVITAKSHGGEKNSVAIAPFNKVVSNLLDTSDRFLDQGAHGNGRVDNEGYV